mgnify:CR=1 FL=1
MVGSAVSMLSYAFLWLNLRFLISDAVTQMLSAGQIFVTKSFTSEAPQLVVRLLDGSDLTLALTWQRSGLGSIAIFAVLFLFLVFPPNFEISDNIVVDGTLPVGEHCVFYGSAKAKGNVINNGNCVVLMGNVISKGNIDIKDETVVGGLVHSEGSVRLGEKVFIGLSVVADGDVELYENSEVKKNILTHGVIKVLKYPRLDLPSLEDIG